MEIVLARWTQEAAHEGVVPQCEDDTWNPKDTEFFAQWAHDAAHEGRVRFEGPGTDPWTVFLVVGTQWMLHLVIVSSVSTLICHCVYAAIVSTSCSRLVL